MVICYIESYGRMHIVCFTFHVKVYQQIFGDVRNYVVTSEIASATSRNDSVILNYIERPLNEFSVAPIQPLISLIPKLWLNTKLYLEKSPIQMPDITNLSLRCSQIHFLMTLPNRPLISRTRISDITNSAPATGAMEAGHSSAVQRNRTYGTVSCAYMHGI